MNARRVAVAALAGGLVAGCTGNATIRDRPGATLATMRAEYESCRELAEREPGMFVSSDGTMAGAIGAGAAKGFAEGIQKAKATDACMTQRGYATRPLTEEETRAIKAAKRGPARDAAIQAVMDGDESVTVEPKGDDGGKSS